MPFRETSNPHKKRKEAVRIKEEPVSDDDRDGRDRSRDNNRKRRAPKSEPGADRNQTRSPTPGDEEQDWGNPQEPSTEKVKEKPNFATSGKLAEDTNTYNGVVIKYNQPTEARKPKRRWRLYPFKGDSDLPFIPIHRQSAYLFGRTRSIADIPIDHPSCSKQHAVLQFRLVSYKRDDATTGRRVRPYIIDLESSNGTFVNNKRIDPRCYVELMEKDVVKFGYSSREYVVLHEESKNDDYDDIQDSN